MPVGLLQDASALELGHLVSAFLLGALPVTSVADQPAFHRHGNVTMQQKNQKQITCPTEACTKTWLLEGQQVARPPDTTLVHGSLQSASELISHYTCTTTCHGLTALLM